MNNTIDVVLRALAIAKNCGLAEDINLYAQAHSRLQSAVKEIREKDEQLNKNGTSPTGDDYKRVLEALGLIQEPAPTDVANASPRHVPALQRTSTDIETAAIVLGVNSAANASSIEVAVLVVNPSDGLIGDHDIDKMPANLDLHTGHLDLADARLGHPILCMDDMTTIYHCGVMYEAAFVTDSVPADTHRDDIIPHIRQNGYRATIDVNSIRYAGTEGMA